MDYKSSVREIEIKLKVKDLDELEKKMSEAGCVFGESFKQHDVIYSDKNNSRKFDEPIEGDVSVRIRYEENSVKLTLKQQRSYQMDCIEYETEIKDPKVFDGMLKVLGWIPECEVCKTRKKGKLGDYEASLDNVEKLGSFVELEMITDDDADPQKAREELFKVMQQFGFSEADEETDGYDIQIYKLENKKSKK